MLQLITSLKTLKLLSIFTLLCCFHLSVQADKLSTEQITEHFSLPSFNKTTFVDLSIKQPCDTYNPLKRNCKNGQYKALASLKQATQQAMPGNLFLIRKGDYQEPLHITQSGTPEDYIGFIAYQAETVRLKMLTLLIMAKSMALFG